MRNLRDTWHQKLAAHPPWQYHTKAPKAVGKTGGACAHAYSWCERGTWHATSATRTQFNETLKRARKQRVPQGSLKGGNFPKASAASSQLKNNRSTDAAIASGPGVPPTKASETCEPVPKNSVHTRGGSVVVLARMQNLRRG